MKLTAFRQRMRESGQGSLEYVGVVAVAAVIVIALIGFAKDWDITTLMTQAVTKVTEAAGWGKK